MESDASDPTLSQAFVAPKAWYANKLDSQVDGNAEVIHMNCDACMSQPYGEFSLPGEPLYSGWLPSDTFTATLADVTNSQDHYAWLDVQVPSTISNVTPLAPNSPVGPSPYPLQCHLTPEHSGPAADSSNWPSIIPTPPANSISSESSGPNFVSIAPKEAPRGLKRPISDSSAFQRPDCVHTDPLSSSQGAFVLAPKRQKRRQCSKQTSLRGTENRRKCSGGFPCGTCVEHWKSECGRTQASLYWTECFSTRITDLNCFWTRSSYLTFAYNPSLNGNDLAAKLHDLETENASEQHTLAALRAGSHVFEIVVDTMADCGLAEFLSNVHESPKRSSLAAQVEFLQTASNIEDDIKPRSAYAPGTRSRFSKPCLLWTFAVLHTHFDVIQRLSRVATLDLLDLRAQLAMEVFRIMAAQIRIMTSKSPTPEARTLLYDCFIVVCTTLCSTAYGLQMTEILMQSPAVFSTSGSVLDAMLKALWQDEQTATEQHVHLLRYCFHWTNKIYSPDLSNLYLLFSIGMLSKLDFYRGFRKPEHPLELAKKFLACFPKSRLARSQRLCLVLFQETEQGRDDVKQMKWIECIQRLKPGENFVTIEPWPAGEVGS